MLSEQTTRLAITVDDLDDSVGEASFADERGEVGTLRELIRSVRIEELREVLEVTHAERRFLARLDDQAVAGSDGCELVHEPACAKLRCQWEVRKAGL